MEVAAGQREALHQGPDDSPVGRSWTRRQPPASGRGARERTRQADLRRACARTRAAGGQERRTRAWRTGGRVRASAEKRNGLPTRKWEQRAVGGATRGARREADACTSRRAPTQAAQTAGRTEAVTSRESSEASKGWRLPPEPWLKAPPKQSGLSHPRRRGRRGCARPGRAAMRPRKGCRRHATIAAAATRPLAAAPSKHPSTWRQGDHPRHAHGSVQPGVASTWDAAAWVSRGRQASGSCARCGGAVAPPSMGAVAAPPRQAAHAETPERVRTAAPGARTTVAATAAPRHIRASPTDNIPPHSPRAKPSQPPQRSGPPQNQHLALNAQDGSVAHGATTANLRLNADAHPVPLRLTHRVPNTLLEKGACPPRPNRRRRIRHVVGAPRHPGPPEPPPCRRSACQEGCQRVLHFSSRQASKPRPQAHDVRIVPNNPRRADRRVAAQKRLNRGLAPPHLSREGVATHRQRDNRTGQFHAPTWPGRSP